MLSLSIAARFLRKSPGQSILIAAGIAVGIGVQVFLGSLIIGLQESLVDQTIGSSSQVTVAGRAAGAGGRLHGVGQGRHRGAVRRSPPRCRCGSSPRILRQGTDTVPLQLTGGELAQLDTIYDISGKTVARRRPASTVADIIVGKDLADKYGLKPGQTVTLVLPDGRRVTETVPRRLRLRLVAGQPQPRRSPPRGVAAGACSATPPSSTPRCRRR